MTFGARLKKLRESKGKIQQEVADSLEIPRATYARYEVNHRFPSYNGLIKLSDYYNVSIDYLVRGKEFESDSNKN